ncbi:calcium-transporting P-type ATPase, PMR1-type [Methanobacterium alcaliphilum]|uniref:calcium-transporting P-type ATPase, PMR1-type n=1 Tax=Methanobacterium alcaliphilum TaxID=392018 RepID=UPI00200ACF4B|nr:calcium-transporting P-type ATPase, PMR1-type [Methanobacterium alcaliphilum]MCK9150358.1 calcium-transporting P-type ATPase, PMR1-type [Methanobacterium alcaliphilum]
MKWGKKSVEETLQELKTTRNGLSSSEAQKRAQDYGPNELVEEKKDGPIKKFIMQFMDILIILLILAAIAAYFVGDAIDAAVILFVVILNATVGFLQENKAEKAMEKLKGLISSEAIVIRDGRTEKIPASQLTLGDIVVIEEGDNVPADIRLIESYDLRIDESSLTGESLPVSKTIDHTKAENERETIAYMDTDVISGRGVGAVVEIGMETSIGKIAEMLQGEDTATPLQEKISGLGKMLGLIAVVVCIGVFILQISKGIPLVETFMTAVSLAVAAVPEGLPAILTLTLALGMQRMAKSNAVVRKLLAVETLGSCTVICTDKTGTLTLNKMSVRDARLNSPEKALEVCALCNNAHLSNGKVIGDPTDGALLLFAEEEDYSREELEKEYPRIMEIPLDSTRKRMSTINKKGDKDYIFSKGAPEIVLSLCKFLEENGTIRELTETDKEKILSDLTEMTGNALRVLGLAYRELDPNEDLEDKDTLESNLIFVGLSGMMDPPRKEAAEAVSICKKAGIKVVMITGDHKDTAAAIAKEIGVLEGGKVLTGTDLDKISDEKFSEIVEDVQVYARVFPEQKVRIVEALQNKDNVVSMTGDGVNDAPALKKASIGVSMGIAGTDVAKESSDMILQDDNFSTIVHAIEEGRTIFDNIRRFVKFQLSTNVGAILTIVSASIMSLPIPFNPIQILWINIIMDGPPAQSLGIEPAEKGIMLREPERDDILPRKSLLRIIFTGIVMAIGTMALYLYELSLGVSTIKATTIAFTVFVMFQIFNVFNCKSRTGFSNRFLLIAVAASFLLQVMVIYVPFFQGIFKTTELGLVDWIWIIAVSALILVSEKIIRIVDPENN